MTPEPHCSTIKSLELEAVDARRRRRADRESLSDIYFSVTDFSTSVDIISHIRDMQLKYSPEQEHSARLQKQHQFIMTIPTTHSIPSISRDNLSRDIPPNTIRLCLGADLLSSRLELGTFVARGHSHNTLSQALASPLGRRVTAAPDPNPAGLGELGVVVQVCPEGEDNLGDARTGNKILAICSDGDFCSGRCFI